MLAQVYTQISSMFRVREEEEEEVETRNERVVYSTDSSAHTFITRAHVFTTGTDTRPSDSGLLRDYLMLQSDRDT